MNIKELVTLIKKAIVVMNNKQKTDPEDIVDYFIEVYTKVLKKIYSDEVFLDDLIKVKSFTRIYLETSSNYNQEFLNILYTVEKYVKNNF